jgi:glyoxylase-like metal-dependent hydrolase (beta-lactamase superfamily II)
MSVSRIQIIKQGSLTLEAFEHPLPSIIAMKYLSGIGGNSTVTCVESDVKILVDTGFEFEMDQGRDNIARNKKLLIQSLKNHALTPHDIDILFITHWHADHFMNYDLFSDSEIIMAEPAVKRHHLEFTKVCEGDTIANGIQVIFTPGHTVDHASLLLSTKPMMYKQRSQHGGIITGVGENKVVIAGDAIVSANYYALNKIWNYNSDFHSESDAKQSVEKICEIADYIIPGHGGMFENIRKERSGSD